MVDRGGFPHGYHRLCGWLPSRPRAAALSSTTVGFVRFGTPCYILLLVSFVTVPASSSVAPPPVIPRKYVVLTKVMSTNELIEHWLLFLLKFNFPRRKKISLCVGLICSRRALLLLLFVCLFVCFLRDPRLIWAPDPTPHPLEKNKRSLLKLSSRSFASPSWKGM